MGAGRNFLLRRCRLWLGLFLLPATFAHAASQAYPLRITVLSAEYRALSEATPIPRDCDLQNYSAYCNESKNPTGQNIMLVQDGQGKSFRIACTVDSRWSKCAALPVGETFEARPEKHGITVLYQDAKGKDRKQFYELVAAAPAPKSGVAAESAPRAAAPPPKPSAVAEAPARAAAPPQNTAAPAPAPPSGSAPGSAPPVLPAPPVLAEKVRCNFSSTPPGADITLDGRYVGNTPSEIGLTTGTHVVVLSMPGFAQWKRELTVASGSEVNVSASLQKTQP